MADDNLSERERDLEIEVGHGTAVDLRSLVSVSRSSRAWLMRSLGTTRGSLVVCDGSLRLSVAAWRLPLRAEAAAEDVSPSAVREIGHVIAGGLSQLETTPKRPAHFSDKALGLAKELANYATDDFQIVVRNGTVGGKLSKQLSVNAEKVLGSPLESLGTIEGKLEALSLHGSKDFSVWPPGGTAIKCLFGSRLDLERDVLPAVNKRVAARGRIKTRPNGERVSVEVDELRVIGGKPASADEVRGILKGYEVADW